MSEGKQTHTNPSDQQPKEVKVARHLHTRTGYKVSLAVKKSTFSEECRLVMTTDNPNIHMALDEAYDEAGIQGYPIIIGVLSVEQLPAQCDKQKRHERYEQ